jgi:hypothetical protein
MKLTVDILEDFIAGMSLKSDVLSFSDDGTNTTLVVEKTFHARAGRTIDVDGSSYNVVSVEFNTNVVVSGVIANPQIITVPNPFYFHGTPLLTNSHISKADDDEVFPMAYLYEILKEKEMNVLSGIQRESEIRLLFLDTANTKEWDTDDHYSERLVGLNGLKDEFISQLRKDICQFHTDETDFTVINRANVGKFVSNKGNIESLFSKPTSGVDVSFTLLIKKSNT